MKKTIIREYKLKHKNIGMSGQISLVFLTDIHNCLSPKEQACIFSLLESAKPDIVLVGGDVLVGKKGKTVELAYRFIKTLSERYKVICQFYCLSLFPYQNIASNQNDVWFRTF